jgi:hypothetical protein
MGMSRIRLRIGRLVLPAEARASRQALVEALRVELTRTLADPAARGRLSRAGRTPVVRLGRLPLAGGDAGGRRFGAALGRAIGGSLGGAAARRPPASGGRP